MTAKNELSRRQMLALGAVALGGAMGSTLFFARPAKARPNDTGRRKVLVCLFMRGGVDGLSLIVPHGDAAYYRERASIALPPPGKPGGVVDLDGRFGLHPRLSPLFEAYRAGELAAIHAIGSPSPTRSHFSAQDYMESGTPGVSSTRDGWLARCLTERQEGNHPLRAVAFGQRLPRALYGRAGALALRNLQSFDLRAPKRARERVQAGFEALYQDGDDGMARAARDALSAVRTLKTLDLDRSASDGAGGYPRSARALREIAMLIKARVGLEVAFVDVGGWDTHTGQNGRLERELEQLGRGLSAFRSDLGAELENVVLVTLSEFGRTVKENGTGGTDHGHATAMLVLGGPVKGGKVYGRFPGLEPDQRFEGRDLQVTTDFRDLFAELATRHLGVQRLERVFPGYAASSAKFPGVIRG
jgi:uncharacterized protein (DUF1501 family)